MEPVNVLFSAVLLRGRGAADGHHSRTQGEAGAVSLPRTPGLSGAELRRRGHDGDRSQQEAAGRGRADKREQTRRTTSPR